MTTRMYFEELPDDVQVQMWTEDDDTTIVINKNLPRRKRAAAVRAALRATKTRRRGELLVPLPILLAALKAKEWMGGHRGLLARAAAVGLAAAMVMAIATNRGRTLPSVAGPSPSAPAVTATVHATPTARSTPAPGRTPHTGTPSHPADGATRHPRRDKTPAPPAPPPRPTRRPQATPAPPEPPEPAPPPTRRTQPTATPPPPQPVPTTISSPESVREPTAEARGCDGINVRVKADPLADVDACLLD